MSGIVGGTDNDNSANEGDVNPAGILLGLGVLCVAGLAVGAVVVRRRRAPERPPEVASEPISLVSPLRRSLPAGGHSVEDPILAAMGLGAARQPDPNAPITRSVHFGAGERPAPPGPRTH